MSFDYGLSLHNNIKYDQSEIGDITALVDGYQDSTRANGGYWSAQFSLKPGMPIHMLEDWYNSYLGFRVQRTVNGVIMWDGLISQMRLTSHGQTYERDLGKMVNRARVDYIGTNGVQRSSTAWSTNANSITQYGQRDEIYTVDGADATLANAFRDTRLTDYGWPRSRGAGGELYTELLSNAVPTLQIMLTGYVFTLNWRYVVANTLLPTVNLSAMMTTLIGEAEFVTADSIATNTLQVMGGFSTPMRGWDAIDKLVQCGDTSGNRYVVQVKSNRKVDYKPAQTAVTYRAIDGKVQALNGETLVAGEVRPDNIIQRTDSIPVQSLATGIYDPRNTYIEQVDFVGGTDSTPSTCRIMTDDWTLADQMQAMLSYDSELHRTEEAQREWDRTHKK